MTTAASFPVNSFKDAAPHLRRPFTPAAVRFKVQATYPKQQPTGALIVSYIDARLVVERLNLIVPHLWHDEYEQVGSGLLMCRLTIDGITRRDVGEGVGKGLYSDALKRAAVKFGIGVSLYATPQAHLKVADGNLKPFKDTLVMTPAGENRVRTVYGMWLDAHGVQAFGEPLDHGDVDESQGDIDAADSPPAVDDTPTLPEDQIKSLAATIREVKPGQERLRNQLIAMGVENVPGGNVSPATLRLLTGEQASDLHEWLSANGAGVTA